jgi:hypothetical protein
VEKLTEIIRLLNAILAFIGVLVILSRIFGVWQCDDCSKLWNLLNLVDAANSAQAEVQSSELPVHVSIAPLLSAIDEKTRKISQ